MKNYLLKIGWLYPDLMSTYGDRGNIMALEKRCEWRGIKTEIMDITINTKLKELKGVDLLFGGGAQDREQEIVMDDLNKGKGGVVKELIDQDVPALFVCGSPQLMGNFYEPAEGKRIMGLGIFDMETRHPGRDKQRLIGNIAAEVYWGNICGDNNLMKESSEYHAGDRDENIVVGFENHGGRTYLGKDTKAFARVLKGFGNNGEDGAEGVVFKNAIGTYLHGPLLPKNPFLADYFIQKALEIKYKEQIKLTELDDKLEKKAQAVILKRLGIYL